MGQRSDEIKKHIDTQRSELSENLERLEERVKSTTDWRAQVDRRPITALGVAFGGGLLLGALIPIAGRRSALSKYRASTTQAYTGSGYTSSSQGMMGSSQGYTGSSEGTTGSYLEQGRRPPKRTATSRELRKTWDMMDTIRAAMVSFGAAKLRDYLGSAIPGFQDHYKRTEEEHRRERSEYNERHPGSQGMTGTGGTGTTGTSGTPGTTGTTGATGTHTPSYSSSTTGQS